MEPQRPRSLRLAKWSSPQLIGVALVAVAAGFGQFGAVAALGDVAKAFGHSTGGTTIAEEAGLSGTTLGVGLAVLRLASLGALPLAALADRVGRRRVLLATCALGLVATALAAGSPDYWWFVALFALGRPLLSGSSAIGQVVVAESTPSSDRARAVALVTAGYGLGSGLTAFLHSVASAALGFRGLFLLALVPLAGLGLLRRLIAEPDRFVVAAPGRTLVNLRVLHRRYRRRLSLVALLAFGLAMTSGPATSFVYLDAEDIVKLPGGVVAAMVLAAGVVGVVGLVAGQWLADHLGRRLTSGSAMVVVAACSMLTYAGPKPALVVGYVSGVFAAAVFAPGAGAISNELFPTEVRAGVAGWLVVASVLGAVCGLVVFGAIADAGGTLRVAALVTFVPTMLIAFGFALLPETKGLEPEQLTVPD